MKNLIIAIALGVLCITAGAQNNESRNKAASDSKDKTTKKEVAKDNGAQKSGNAKTFIDRYYMIRDSYKDMPAEVYGAFAASDYDMEKFMERYNSLKDGYPELARYAANYAGSKKDAKEFETRFFEVKEAAAELAPVRGEYAASKNDLKEFQTRYHEIKAAYPNMDQKVYGAYACSNHKLDKFMERYNAIKASYADADKAFEHYAAADKDLTKGTASENKPKAKNNKKQG